MPGILIWAVDQELCKVVSPQQCGKSAELAWEMQWHGDAFNQVTWVLSVAHYGFVDETYVKVSGSWRYVYRAVDEAGQVIDVFVSKKRDGKAARRFFSSAIGVHGAPTEVTTDRSRALAGAITQLLPFALHDTTQYANNRIEADHGRLKARRARCED